MTAVNASRRVLPLRAFGERSDQVVVLELNYNPE